RRHQDRAADAKRAAKLDPLDARVPLGPALDVRPELPNGLGPRARLEGVFDGPHETNSNPDVGFPTDCQAEARIERCSSKLREVKHGSEGVEPAPARRWADPQGFRPRYQRPGNRRRRVAAWRR